MYYLIYVEINENAIISFILKSIFRYFWIFTRFFLPIVDKK